MGGISQHSRVGSGVERTAGVGSVFLDGEEDDGAEGRYEESYSANAVDSFQIVDNAPTSGWNVVVVIP